MPKKTPNLTLRLVADAHLYRWNPGPALRAAGFRGVDLWADGPALTLADWRALGFAGAVTDALRLKSPRGRAMPPKDAARCAGLLTAAAREALARRRAGEPSIPGEKINTGGHLTSASRRATLDRLIRDFLDAKAKTLPVKTIVNYRSHLAPIIEAWGDEIPAALTKEAMLDITETLAERGPHAAYKAVKTLQTALIWAAGRDRWKGGVMPAPEAYLRLGIAKPRPRLRVATPEEADAMMLAVTDPHRIYAMKNVPAAARTLRPRPSLADALAALLWTAARVGDALSLHDGNIRTGEGRDWIVYRQEKTGLVTSIPVIGALKDRLPDMTARRLIVWRKLDMTPPEQAAPLIVSEEDGLSYRRARPSGLVDHRPFNDLWLQYRALAARLEPSLEGKGRDPLGEPWLDFRPQDCRDTACTRLLDAGCELPEIAAWHGSSVENVIRLIRHYVAIAPKHAATAGDKLEAYRKKGGISA